MSNREEVLAAQETLYHAGENLATAKAKELEFETRRSLVKSEAISRIMMQQDPQKEGKYYSATAAAEIVMSDAAYALHQRDQADATFATILCAAIYEGAKLALLFAVNEAAIAGFEPLRLALDKDHTMRMN